MRSILIIILMGVLIVLAACGDDGNEDGDSQESEPLNVTLESPPNHNIVQGCTPEQIEEWFDMAYPRVDTFITTSRPAARSADEDNRSEVNRSLRTIVIQRNTFATVETPDCIEHQTDNILTSMSTIIENFQEFVNGDIDSAELSEQVLPAIREMETEYEQIYSDVAELWTSSE